MNSLVTTAISYPNSEPHIGHMYEAIYADIINRTLNIYPFNSKLLTGTDEHGKKIQSTALSKQMTPKELCDNNSILFKLMLLKIECKYERFIRTTDNDHYKIVNDSINYVFEKYVYKGTYSGYYNVREESYLSNTEALLNNFIDPVSGIPYEIRTEECYFFKLSQFKDQIIDILDRVYGFNVDSFKDRLDDLQDLCISRKKSSEFDWGIDFPNDNNHIVYVWFDALLNYITGELSIFSNNEDVVNTVHIIGKDIVWFHSVIYPAILNACGYKMYNNILVHGFILDNNGIKMSKSLGNIITPQELLNEFPVEYIRFYFFMETNISDKSCNDIKFSKERLMSISNTILVRGFYNLFQRFYKLVSNINFNFNKYIFNPTYFSVKDSIYNTENLKNKLIDSIDICNNNITYNQPWKMNLEDKLEFMQNVIGENLFIAMCILSCIIPDKIKILNSKLGFNIPGISYEQNPVYNYDPDFKSF